MMKHSSLDEIINRLKTLKNSSYFNKFLLVIKSLKDLKNRHSEININTAYQKNSESLSIKEEAAEFIKSMFTAMILALIIRTFLLQPFSIPSESMLPNLLVGDYLFVNKFAYGYSQYSVPFAPNIFKGRIFEAEPKRGDVAVFRVVDDGNKDYIKRVVGLPGDRIRFENGSIIVNDKPAFIKENGNFGTDTINPETVGAKILVEKLGSKEFDILDVFATPYDNTGEYIVPENHFFFAGDNRDNSQDSRFIGGPVGFIHKDKLIGRAEFIFFSIKDSSFLEFWNWYGNIRFERILKKIN